MTPPPIIASNSSKTTSNNADSSHHIQYEFQQFLTQSHGADLQTFCTIDYISYEIKQVIMCYYDPRNVIF